MDWTLLVTSVVAGVLFLGLVVMSFVFFLVTREYNRYIKKYDEDGKKYLEQRAILEEVVRLLHRQYLELRKLADSPQIRVKHRAERAALLERARQVSLPDAVVPQVSID